MERDNHARISMLILVCGVVLSSGLGVFFYFRTDLSTALATFAGLIGTTITLQIESLLRARQARENATRHQRVLARLEATPWMPELLDRALAAYGVVEQSFKSGMAIGLARRAFENCQIQLEALARGRYSTPDPDESPNSPIYKLTEQIRTSMLATSVGGDLRWWLDTPATRNWWRLNLEALTRGVAIKRILIYHAWSDDLDRLARTQHEAGVLVMRVSEDELPAPLRLNLIIWDGSCALEPEYNFSGEWINATYTFAPQDLALALERFKLIESCAEPWPAPVAR